MREAHVARGRADAAETAVILPAGAALGTERPWLQLGAGGRPRALRVAGLSQLADGARGSRRRGGAKMGALDQAGRLPPGLVEAGVAGRPARPWIKPASPSFLKDGATGRAGCDGMGFSDRGGCASP
jgi:hypothetical protein